MKAGIYKRRDTGKHVYIAKDRSIRAYEFIGAHPYDGKTLVSTTEKGRVVSWTVSALAMGPNGLQKVYAHADRVADAPNGCTDHVQALRDYLPVSTIDFSGPYAALAADYSEIETRTMAAIAAGFVANPDVRGDLDRWANRLRTVETKLPQPTHRQVTLKEIGAMLKWHKTNNHRGLLGNLGSNSTSHWWAAKVAQGSIRLIGKQSKRKHRRAGHQVFWCAPLASWAWQVQS